MRPMPATVKLEVGPVAAEVDDVVEDHQPENPKKNGREARGVSASHESRRGSLYAAIYARVSTEDQGTDYTIPTQIEACQNHTD
jgi:hypothetical protein